MLVPFLLPLISCSAAQFSKQPKHVLLIVADDLGRADLGFTGSQIKTPNIDKIRADGVFMDSFYVQRACSPTRAALMTGRYNIRYGLQSGVLEEYNNYTLSLNETLMPEILKRETKIAESHMVGKWHLGYHHWEHTPTFRGFDSYLGYYSGDADYFTHKGDCGGFDLKVEDQPKCGQACSRHMWEAQGIYSTHLFTSRAVDIIDRFNSTDGGLFMYLPYQAVHVPDQVPPEYMAPYNFSSVEGTNARNYLAGMLAALDEGVGIITRSLKQRGMWEDTLVWFQTDNGAATPACGGWTGAQNWPLRGGKCTAWEGGLRGTAIMSGAGIDPSRAGATEYSIMHTVDVLPTLAAALRGSGSESFKSDLPLDGVSQWETIAQGAKAVRDTVLLECDPYANPWSNGGAHDSGLPADYRCGGDQHATPYYAIRQNQWKLLLGDPGDDGGSPKGIGNGWWCTGPPCPASHNNSQHVGGPFPVTSVMLFNVVHDPSETTDLSKQNPAIVEQLIALIKEYNATAVDARGECRPADPQQSPKLHNGTCTPYGEDPQTSLETSLAALVV